jgi:hypothetical protein
MDFKQRSLERQIASEIAHEIHRVSGPTLPENLDQETVCGIFADHFDRHKIVAEDVGGRILNKYVPRELAKLNSKFAELNQKFDAAMRQRKL